VVWLKLPTFGDRDRCRAVAAVVLAVSVKGAAAVVLAGLKLAVTPLGRPEAARLTLPLKPPVGLTVMVLVPLFPCVTVKLAGDADSEKSGTAAAFTVRLTVVVWLKLPRFR